MFREQIEFIKGLYAKNELSLHEPVFGGNELKYVSECINSTFVSSVGQFVNKFEESVCQFTGAKFAVATTNGTSALHLALVALGVEAEDEVITQNITFIATVNAISYCRAVPIIIDCDEDNLGLSPRLLERFLDENAELMDGICVNKKTKRKIKACLPMHVFGHPVKLDDLILVCKKWNITIIEDAAESLGSYYKGRHTGTFGEVGILSFNGNKVVTTGGGGMVVTNNSELAKHLKHLSTTARVAHKWDFIHDEIGFNYRLPNLNAALGVAQLEVLPSFLENKRDTAKSYKTYFESKSIKFWNESLDTRCNFWLNAIILKDKNERDVFLEQTNSSGLMTRPLWSLISDLKIYNHAVKTSYPNSEYFRDRLVNIPSGVRR
ncbi:MAG: LegC family aminotransferase [Bacteriovoracaceae bacterium]|nr:LegC family aminotransferase [Bacteriovoracaceae bacterium]